MKRFKRSPNFSGLSRMMLLAVLVSAAGLLFAQTLPNPPELIPYRKGDKWGFCDRNKKIVIECEYDNVWKFDEKTGLAMVERNEKFGYIDKLGKEVVQLKYDEVGWFAEGLFVARLQDKFGFVNSEGQEVIPPQYEEAIGFSDGLAAVKLNDRWGYIDKTGKVVIPFNFDIAESFIKGVARVNINGNYTYINRDGNSILPDDCWEDRHRNSYFGDYIIVYKEMVDEYGYREIKYGLFNKQGHKVLPCEFDLIESISEGRIIFFKEYMLGIADTNGKIILEPKYNDDDHYIAEEEYKFSDGMMRIWQNGKYGFINRMGKEAIPPKYDDVHHFFEGLAAVKLNDRWGFVDTTGKEVIPLKYDFVHNFSQGLAPIGKGKKYGLINKKGEEIAKPIYEEIGLVGNVIALKQNKWGFIDKIGKIVQNFQYDDIKIYEDGYAGVLKNGLWGIVDGNGKEIVSPKYEQLPGVKEEFIYTDLNLFYENIARVSKNELWGFIDIMGKEIVPPKYESAHDFSQGLAEVIFEGKSGFIDALGTEYWK